MIHESRLRFLALFLGAFLVAACDSGTEPGAENFDAEEISAGVDAAITPIEASGEANFVLTSFLSSMLDGSFAPARLDRSTLIRDTRIRTLARQVDMRPEVEIPAEMQGQTFVYNPNEFTWEPDETREGAPTNGLRVIWYDTDPSGSISEPLQELGYIDLTDEDDSVFERLGVTIVRSADEVIVADYTHGYAATEDDVGYTEAIEFTGTFSDGTSDVDVDMVLDAEGEWDGAESYEWELFFDGAEASYRWSLTGASNEAQDVFEDHLVVTINSNGAATVLDLDLVGSDAGTGEGTITHGGDLVANVAVSGDSYSFSKPGGGSFTQEEEEGLYGLMVTMIIYGPLLLLTLPLVFIA